MAITIEVSGVQYTQYLSLSVTEQLDALCNSFSMDVTTPNGNPLPFRSNEPCIIRVNGIKKMTGRLEDANGSYSASDHTLTFNGRDNTCDIVDSSLDAVSDIGAAPTLKQLIQIVLNQLELPLKVIESVSTAPFNAAEDNIAIEAGTNAFEFLQTLSNKRQVLLSSNADGDIEITQAKGLMSNGRLQNLDKSDPRSNKNNVITASWNYATSERFYQYTCSSKLNPTAAANAGEADLDSVVSQSGRATDDEVRTSRRMVFKAEKASSSAESQARAQWEANIRKTRSMTYSCTIGGHTISDTSSELWDTNTLVYVVDAFAGIDAYMLVNKVTFKSSNDGNETELELVDKNAYTTKINEPVSETKTNKKGKGIFASEAEIAKELAGVK